MATIAERIAAATKAAEAAEAVVSGDDFVAEEAARKQLAELQERKREAESRARDMLVARLLDDAPEDAEAVVIETKPHVFLVRGAGSRAYQTWRQGGLDAATDKIVKGTRDKVKKEDVDRAYAVAGIVGWNFDGHSMDIEDSEDGKKLNDCLRENPAFVSQVLDRIARLDGAASEARKR